MAGPPPPGPPPPPSLGNNTTSIPPIPADRNALLASIRQGASLKKTETDDRSAPKVGGGVIENGTNKKPTSSAPAVPKSTSSSGGMDLNSMLQNAFNAKKMHASESSYNNDVRNELKIPSAPPIPGAAPSVPPPMPSEAPNIPPSMPNTAPNVPPPMPETVAPLPTSNAVNSKHEDSTATHFNPMSGGLPFLAEIQKKRDDVHVIDDSSVPDVSNKQTNNSKRDTSGQRSTSHNLAVPPVPSSAPSAPELPSSTPQAPPLPSSVPAPPPIPSSVPKAPPIPSSAPKAPELPSNTPQAPPLPSSVPAPPPTPSSVPKAPELPSSMPKAPELAKNIPKAPEIPSSVPVAPPLPSSTPKAPELPSSTPQAPSMPSSIPQAPPLPSSVPAAPPLPSSMPKAPELPSSTLQAPPIPSSIPKAPELPSSTPQAPPLPSSVPAAPPLPSSTPKAPSLPSLSTNADTIKTPPVNPLVGGLPFLAEIQKKRDDTYVVDEKNVAAVSKHGASNLQHKELKLSTGAKTPSAPNMPPPLQQSAPSAPSTPSMPPPLQQSAPSAPSAPSMPPPLQQSATIGENTKVEDMSTTAYRSNDTGTTKKAPPPPPAVENKPKGNYKTRLFSDGTTTSSAVTREGRPDEQLTDSSSYINKAGMRKQLADVAIPESTRFKWLTKDEMPIPRPFLGRTKLYPSGRGSSVPLNFKLYE